MSKQRRQFKCEVCGATFYNFQNYFNHQQKCREWCNLGLKAINKALEMLKVTYKDEFEVVSNNCEYRILQDDEGICYPTEYIDMDLTLKYKGKEFNTDNYIFSNINYNNPTDIYFKIITHYILPLEAGYSTYEEWQFSKLSSKDKKYAKYYIDNSLKNLLG